MWEGLTVHGAMLGTLCKKQASLKNQIKKRSKTVSSIAQWLLHYIEHIHLDMVVELIVYYKTVYYGVCMCEYVMYVCMYV